MINQEKTAVVDERIEEAKINGKSLTFKNLMYKYGTLLAVAALLAVFTGIMPDFMTVGNMTDVLRSVSVLTIVSLAFTIPLAANAFNLSVAAVAGFSGTLTAGLMVWHLFNPVIASLIGIGVGVLASIAIALFVIAFKVDDLLVSLGMMFILNGLTVTYTGGLNIYSHMLKSGGNGNFITAPGIIPHSFLFMGQGYIGFVPMPVIIMLVVLIFVHLFLNNTFWGRHLYSIGGNAEASHLAGISINWNRILMYSLSGAFAAIGGILLVARLGSAQIGETQALVLESVAATYIGFGVLGAGVPNALGTFVGAFLLGTMDTGLTMLGVSYTMQDVFKGFILLAALVLSAKRDR